MSGWIGIDLDGTLARYESGDGIVTIGEPIPKMVEFVKQILAEGVYEVRIMTARVSGKELPAIAYQEYIIREWCKRHIGQYLPVTCEKDYNMVALYDDRAYHVVRNEGVIL